MKPLGVRRVAEPRRRNALLPPLLQSLLGFTFGHNPLFYFPDKSLEGLKLPISLDEKSIVQQKGCGLINGELACAKNAVLQLLAHLPPMAHLAKSKILSAGSEVAGATDFQYEFYRGIDNLVSLKSGKSCPAISRFEKFLDATEQLQLQQDMPDGKEQCASEYLLYILNRLNEYSPQTGIHTEMGRLFGFYTHQEFKCQSCYNYRTTGPKFENALMLALKPKEKETFKYNRQNIQIYSSMGGGPIVIDMDDIQLLPTIMLNNLQSAQPISLPCEACLQQTSFCERASIAVPPNVLLTVLKRGNGKGVNRCDVELPQKLSLTPFLREGCGYDQLDNTYELYGFISHCETEAGGHYVAYCRKGDQWYEYDDRRVTPVETSLISKKYDGCLAAYCRVQSIPVPSSLNEFKEVVLPPSRKPIILDGVSQKPSVVDEVTDGLAKGFTSIWSAFKGLRTSRRTASSQTYSSQLEALPSERTEASSLSTFFG